MTSAVLRTIVLGLAWFAGINLLASLAAAIVSTRVAGRTVSTDQPWVPLSLRLFPAAASILLVVGMFLPIQWAFEPRDVTEAVGVVWFGLAAAGFALLLRSGWCAIRVADATRRFKAAARIGRSSSADPIEIDSLRGVSLAGILRPRILIGASAKAELSGAELEVAIAHEVAHRDALDNLTRWCMLCAPDFLAWSATASRLQHDWRVGAESRADARAVGGDRVRAVHLASALIKVARLAAAPTDASPVPSWSALNDSELLEFRVKRLLNGAVEGMRPVTQWMPIAATVFAGLTLAVLVLGEPIHHLTELLVAALP